MTWSFGPCSQRPRLAESIDDPSLDDESLDHAYDFIEFVNRRVGGDRIVLNALETFSNRWTHDIPISILDLRCGRGGLCRVIANWARHHNFDIRLLGADPNPRVIRLARDRHRDYHEIAFEIRDFSDPLFLQAQQFDIVISSMSFHRTSMDEAEQWLKIVNRLAKRGYVIVDWLRDVRGLAWMSMLSAFWGDPHVKRDAALAIRSGFTMAEVRALLKKVSLDDAQLQKNFGYRFSIIGERGLALSAEFSPVTGLAT